MLALRSNIPVNQFYLIESLEILKNIAWITLLLSVLGIRRAVFAMYRGEEYPQNLVVIAGVALGIPGILLLSILYYRLVEGTIFFYPAFGGRSILAGFLLVEMCIRDRLTT